ncbi:MAG: hypothetical protein IPH74_00385 [Bacteroidetes bacterium]|jgi:outer membrane protein OmpA-like peptidoglycan-associated protein|nr:hypothetical protein [Bacteroidota bacterium]MBK7137549.1 hypothetical protein [Bacteroidota bacterium]MBK7505956.1 hypothetical protein [Bacteroidota bacterium]MBK7639065.1 hypothetical protein [Bacteroidota bacterium]MBK8674620.1 hypothetical protein [Bacteroidota bacterium]
MKKAIFSIILFLGFSNAFGQDNVEPLEQFFFQTENIQAPPVFIETILFSALETKIEPIYFPYLDKVCQSMIDNPNLKLVCSSFTDNSLDSKNAITITQGRYTALVTYFIKRGFEPSRIELRQTGKETPLELGNSPELKTRINRIELRFEY